MKKTTGDHSQNQSTTRRRFLQQSAAIGVISSGYFVNPVAGKPSSSPNERLRIAAVGATNRAGANIRGCASQDIVAIADVDGNLLEQGSAAYPNARKYRDYRVMLEKEAEKIDAVLVGTPDHSHAPASAMALRLKKHVYCEKPLTHTVYEARVLSDLARENKLVTQMGTQIHAGDNYRRVVELIQGNAIGPVKEVHVWSSAVYTGGKFKTDVPCPAHVDWDLWLGPAPERPYSPDVHPFAWRRFWDYGAGSLGDFGCHYMDLAHWALDLKHPVKIDAHGPEVDAVSTPAWCKVQYDYPSRGEMPALKLFWYDSGKKPELLSTLKNKKGEPLNWNSGQLFVGENGMLLSDYGRHVLLPEEQFEDFERPEPTIPKSIGHHTEWIQAIRNGETTTCNFDYSGALTEAVLLGTVSYRSGKAIEWDAENLKVTNAPEAQPLIHKEYRKGWTL